jgi:glycosyltransferase involved in cell wall biosynthesis
MRIGLITGEFPPMEGGVGAFTEQLARALAALGHEIHVITSKGARPADAPRTVSAVMQPTDLGYALLHPRVARWGWSAISTVADLAVRHDLDIVNVQYQAAAFDMRNPAIHFLPWRLKGVAPTVITFHDLRVPYLFPKAGGLRERAVRSMARRAGGSIATNAADFYRLHHWTDGPLRQIPIGSNIDAYEPNHIELAEVRSGLNLGEGDILLGYFGFLNPMKGADSLIEALARLDGHYHLVFIGGRTGASDPDNNEAFLSQLRQRIDALGLNERVHWTGFLSPARVSAHLVAADVMVMPYRDGVSPRRGTLMAVLAHGRPLITTMPTEISPEFRHGENMWLVPPDNGQALADAVMALAADPLLRGRLGHEARLVAQSYGWSAIAERTAAFYAEVFDAYSRGSLK